MRATRRGVALVRQPTPDPANDNVPGAITPEDRSFFLALALVCAWVVALAVYMAFTGPDDVASALGW